MSRWSLGACFFVTDGCFPKKTMASLNAHASSCKCSDPNCPAVSMMRKISDMPTNGDVWSIETVSGFTMSTTAAVKNRLDVVQVICCKMVTGDMTEEQMRPEFERALQGQDLAARRSPARSPD